MEEAAAESGDSVGSGPAVSQRSGGVCSGAVSEATTAPLIPSSPPPPFQACSLSARGLPHPGSAQTCHPFLHFARGLVLGQQRRLKLRHNGSPLESVLFLPFKLSAPLPLSLPLPAPLLRLVLLQPPPAVLSWRSCNFLATAGIKNELQARKDAGVYGEVKINESEEKYDLVTP